jgi:hypothetical protein
MTKKFHGEVLPAALIILHCINVDAGRGLQPRPPLRGGNVKSAYLRYFHVADGVANPVRHKP